jgi:hypothetical protein
VSETKMLKLEDCGLCGPGCCSLLLLTGLCAGGCEKDGHTLASVDEGREKLARAHRFGDDDDEPERIDNCPGCEDRP